MPIAIQGKRILLTGVSGFLGRVVCHQLRKHGGYVTGMDRNPPEAIEQATKPTLMLPQDFIQLDLGTCVEIKYQSSKLYSRNSLHPIGTLITRKSLN